jgi:hypothetical protein
MSFSFVIDKSIQILEQQWTYLSDLGVTKKLIAIKHFYYKLSIFTLFYPLLYFFTSSDRFIELKAVFMLIIAITWLVSFIFCLFFLWKQYKNKKRLRRFLRGFSEDKLKYGVEIDDEKVTINSNNQTSEYPWTNFIAYHLHKETIYVLNGVSGYYSLYWDRTEMGPEAYSALLELLQRKSIKQLF